MRLSLGLLVVGSVVLAACSGQDGIGGVQRGSGSGSDERGGTPGTTPGAVTPAAVSCPATVSAATAISTSETNATDVCLLLGGDVVYRDAQKVYRAKAKAARAEVYTSPDLLHAFADDSVLVTIESPNPPDAILKVMPVAGTITPVPQPPSDTKGGIGTAGALSVTPAGWSAGGTHVFASDATSLYILADVTNVGDTIYQVNKANPNQMTVLAQLQATLSDPQLAGTDVWFVRDQKRVYKVAITAVADPLLEKGAGVASPPVEVFGLGYADCKLAVGGMHAFCSTGTALEQRDLSGANLLTVLDSQKGATPSVLGAAVYGNDTVFVRTLPSSATDLLKNGIRTVKTGGAAPEDKLLACGREAITAIAVDATSVVWAEKGKGVFSAPR